MANADKEIENYTHDEVLKRQPRYLPVARDLREIQCRWRDFRRSPRQRIVGVSLKKGVISTPCTFFLRSSETGQKVVRSCSAVSGTNELRGRCSLFCCFLLQTLTDARPLPMRL